MERPGRGANVSVRIDQLDVDGGWDLHVGAGIHRYCGADDEVMAGSGEDRFGRGKVRPRRADGRIRAGQAVVPYGRRIEGIDRSFGQAAQCGGWESAGRRRTDGYIASEAVRIACPSGGDDGVRCDIRRISIAVPRDAYR